MCFIVTVVVIVIIVITTEDSPIVFLQLLRKSKQDANSGRDNNREHESQTIPCRAKTITKFMPSTIVGVYLIALTNTAKQGIRLYPFTSNTEQAKLPIYMSCRVREVAVQLSFVNMQHLLYSKWAVLVVVR